MWLRFLDWLFYSLLTLNPDNHWVAAAHFFAYDSVRLIFLLFFMIFIIGFFRTYVPLEKIKRLVEKSNKVVAHTIASFFGSITPFCSCSSIPLFIAFLKSKVPLGVAFSFLITSPLVNEYVVALMLGTFGWKITLVYIFAGMLIGILGGMFLRNKRFESYLEKDLTQSKNLKKEKLPKLFKERLFFGLQEATDIIKKLWLWVLVGVALGAVIHNLVPELFIQKAMLSLGVFAVPLAVILGVPLYGNSVAMIPVALALFTKGVPLGTVMALLMSTVALSFPEAVILRRAMNLKLILIFFGIVAAGIVIIGYVLNITQVFFL